MSMARAESLTTIRQLAALHVVLVDTLALEDVTVVGNSVGGWMRLSVTSALWA
jgi:hypothetical protein